MSFYRTLKDREDKYIDEKLRGITEQEIYHVLEKEILDEKDFLVILSEKAADYLETMARRANELTLKNFGRVIHLYSPLYLSNFCDNECVYCGFKHSNAITRKKLCLEEVELEAKAVAATGILHLLALTGESRKEAPASYIKDCVNVLKKYFSSVSIEIYPLQQEEYAEFVLCGVDGLTIYQETYDENTYQRIHLKGLKKDFRFRMDAPERACNAQMRSVNIGALLGLSDFRKDVYFTGLHASYIQSKFPGTEVGVSFPRIQPQTGNFLPANPVSDKQLVQAILAVRLFMPRAAINISTRENSALRKNLIGLGVTRMSAGSRTEVGGYTASIKTEGQFEVNDNSSVAQAKEMISLKGYQPVMKDWLMI